MPNLTKHDSFLKNLLDGDVFNPFHSNNVFLVPSGIAVDISDNDTSYTIKANLPGFAQENVEIEMHENVLTIKGNTEKESKEEAPNYLLQERKTGSFCRSFSFREPIESDKSSASFENGVLTIILPKQEPERPKKVKINIQ